MPPAGDTVVCIGETGLLLISSALLCLIGLDLKISYMRWKQGIKDLNPLVQHFVKIKPIYGVLALANLNLLIMAAAFQYLPLVWMLLGGKLALATLQIRSLIENVSSNV
jgi:hypothetical protein